MTRIVFAAAAILAALAVAPASAAPDDGAMDCPPAEGPVAAPQLDRPEGYVECIEAEERLAAIQAFGGRWAACYEAQDAACIAALYDRDALMIPAGGMPLRGAAIEAYYSGLFDVCEEGQARALTLAYESIDAGEERAVVIQNWTVTVTIPGEAASASHSGRSMLVLAPVADGWRILRQMDGDAMAPPAEGCPPVM